MSKISTSQEKQYLLIGKELAERTIHRSMNMDDLNRMLLEYKNSLSEGEFYVLTKSFSDELETNIRNERKNIASKIAVDREKTLHRLFGKMNEFVLGELYELSKCLDKPLTSGVYFLRNKETGLIKIGCATDVVKRINQIKSAFVHIGYPVSLKLEAVHLCFQRHIYHAETFFHEYFKREHKTGEWFDVSTDEIIDAFSFCGADVYRIEGVWFSVNDIESSRFKPLKKNLAVSPLSIEGEIENRFDSVFKFPPKNILYDIVEKALSNNTNIYATDYQAFPSLLRGIKTEGATQTHTFESLKKEKFDRSFAYKLIQSANSLL